MKLPEMRSKVKIDIADATLDDDVLDRCIQRAVDDLSRFFPLEQAYETTLIFTITGEAWTSGAAHGTYVSLANKPIRPGTDNVYNTAGTVTYVRDTDYTIDYINGRITTISTGAMVVGTGYKINYTKSKLGLDISALTDVIRINSVEYPASNAVPQTFISFSVWGSFLYVGASNTSQQEMVEKNHIVIYYEKKQTPPTDSTDGTYPTSLDQPITIGAGSYILFTKAYEMELQAVTDTTSLRTLMDDISDDHDEAMSALDKVATYITGTNASSGVLSTAITLLTSVALTAPRTAVSTALTAASSALSDITTGVAAQLAGTPAISVITTACAAASAACAAATSALSDVTNGVVAQLALTPAQNLITAACSSASSACAASTTALAGITSDVSSLRSKIYAVNEIITKATTGLDSIITADITAIDGIYTEASVGEKAKVALGAGLIPTSTGSGAVDFLNYGTAPSAKKYLDDGDAKIDALNNGQTVGSVYAEFANSCTGIVNGFKSLHDAYMDEASAIANYRVGKINLVNARVAEMSALVNQNSSIAEVINSYIQQANANTSQASGYADVASALVADVNAIVSRANAVSNLAQTYTQEATAYVDEANALAASINAVAAKANAIVGMAQAYLQEASGYNAVVEGVNNEAAVMSNIAEEYGKIADRYISEAQGRLAAAAQKASACERFYQTILSDLNISDKFRTEAIDRKNEFWTILKDRSQYRTQVSRVALRQ